MKTLITAMFAFAFTTSLLVAENQVLWDASKTWPDQWKTETGISAAVESGALVLRSKDADFGWAAVNESVPLRDSATIDLEVKEARGGQLVVQVEWMEQDGAFIRAVELLKPGKTGSKITARKLSEFLPEGEKPKRLRLKFWVEGRNAEIQIAQAVIRAPRSD